MPADCGVFGGGSGSAEQEPDEGPTPANAGVVDPGGSEPRRTLASQDATDNGTDLHVAVHELVRQGEMTFSVTGVDDGNRTFMRQFSGGDVVHPDSDSVAAVELFDPVDSRVHLVARDSGGNCVCSAPKWGDSLDPGGSVLLSATFGAPPEDVDAMTVRMPLTGSLSNVPIGWATACPRGPRGRRAVRDHRVDAHRGRGGHRPVLSSAGATEVATAPVLDVGYPILDVTVATENLRGSVTDAAGSDERTVTLAADVVFGFDSAELTAEAEESLEEAAGVLRSDAVGRTVSVNGSTGSRGEEDNSLALSEERARAVEEGLGALLFDVDIAFEAAGHGSAGPVAPNEIDGADSPEGRAGNRRGKIRFARRGAPRSARRRGCPRRV